MEYLLVLGVIIKNDIAVVVDSTGLAKCNVDLRILTVKIIVVIQMQASANIVAENGYRHIRSSVFQQDKRFQAYVIVYYENAMLR